MALQGVKTFERIKEGKEYGEKYDFYRKCNKKI